jgi:glucokinase
MELLPQVAGHLASARDPTPVIVCAAVDPEKPSPLCRRTLETFVSILGAEAGNLALKVLATGGIYLGGGILPRILPFLQAGGFMQTYQHKGRFGSMVARMPVHVILNPKAALLGAARAGLSEF